MYIDEAFLQEALDALKKDIFSSFHFAMPGIIEAYDSETGLASVQPALRRRTSDGKILTAPLLEEVPVFLPAADLWLRSGQPVLPPSPRKHDWSDAVALVGFAPAFPPPQQ